MNTLSLWKSDSITMLRRNFLHMLRYPSVTIMLVGMPVVLFLLFVYVFGGTLGDGISGQTSGRAAYIDYVAPGILLLTVAAISQGTAISVAMDMTEGIIARFRTMAISSASVLTGHVLGAMIRTALAVVAIIGVALLLGFRPTAGPAEWIAAIGVLTMFSWALTWLTVAIGLVSGSVETASNAPMPLMLLPFFSSGFVPTDSMPTVLRWFAEYQPFTPVTETLRGLLMGTDIGNSAILAVAWCVAVTLVGYLWARAAYNRGRAH